MDEYGAAVSSCTIVAQGTNGINRISDKRETSVDSHCSAGVSSTSKLYMIACSRREQLQMPCVRTSHIRNGTIRDNYWVFGKMFVQEMTSYLAYETGVCNF
jgi:hypothetical protein